MDNKKTCESKNGIFDESKSLEEIVSSIENDMNSANSDNFVKHLDALLYTLSKCKSNFFEIRSKKVEDRTRIENCAMLIYDTLVIEAASLNIEKTRAKIKMK